MAALNPFRWLVYQQDYLWFLVALGSIALLVAWWRFARPDGPLAWLPWAAGAGVLTAALEISQLVTPVEVTPWLPPWLGWDLAVGAVMALLAAGCWWEATVRGRGWRHRLAGAFVIISVCAAAAWRIRFPEIGGWMSAGVLTAAAAVLAGRAGTPRSERVGLGSLALSGWLATAGPLAERLHLSHRFSEVSVFGPAAASCQLIVVVAVGWLLSQAATRDESDGAAGVEKRQLRHFLICWLSVGIALASIFGRWARVAFERDLEARVLLSAQLVDCEQLSASLGPQFRIDSIFNIRNSSGSGRTLVACRSSFLATGAMKPIARHLTTIEAANPNVRCAMFLTIRRGLLVLCSMSTRIPMLPDTRAIFGDLDAREWNAWASRRVQVLGPIDFYYGDIVQARAPLVSNDRRMLGWLALDVGVAHWLAAQVQARLLAFSVVALGSGLIILNWRQRQRERERETARRAAAAAAAANQLKTEFLAKVSHELRTPLQSVLGYAQLLQEVVRDPKAGNWLGALRQHSELMTRLVNDLIDLSAIESGGFQLNPKIISPSDLLAQTVESFRPRAEAKGLGLALVTEACAVDWALVDGERLRQVALNLIGNAIKFTDRGGVTVALRSDALPGGAIRLSLMVRDTGPGISAADQPRLFAAFTRLEATAEKEGSGLGLALSAALCRRMGGDVVLESDGRSGSCFTATIECARAERPVEATPGERSPALQGMRILVVDDNPLVRELFVAFLTEQGAECAADADGLAALARTVERSFDAVILDLALPGLNGAEIARRLRLAQSTARPMRIVGVSAHASAGDRSRALAAGMDRFLVKPVLLNELASALGDAGSLREVGTTLRATDALRARLARQFRAELPRQRMELESAIVGRQWPRVQALAHHLKNSAVVVGDAALIDACTGLEAAAQAGDESVATRHWLRCQRSLDAWQTSDEPLSLSAV